MKGPWISRALGALSVLAVLGFLAMELLSDPGEGLAPTLKVEATGDALLGEGRFKYSSSFELRASRQGGAACLGALGREGQLLGGLRPLRAEGTGWALEARISEICQAHYGPLWLVVFEGERGCEGLAPLLAVARDADQPTEAIARALATDGRWRWGKLRIYVHDKLP